MQSSKAGICFALAFIAVLVVSEGALRLFQVHHPASFFTSDPDLGYALRPNAEGWNEEESDCYTRINSDGMRDREHTIARPRDVVRIAFLGDSTTEAYHLPVEKTYVALTEAALNRMTHKKVEALNFGVRGYNLPQELFQLPKKVWKYDPQVVVLALSINGAILKSVRSLYPGDPQNAPFFVLEHGALTLDRQSRDFKAHFRSPTRRDRIMDFINRSELLCLVNAARVQSSFRLAALESMIEPHAEASAGASLDELSYLGPATEPLRQAWDLSFKTMLAIRDEVARHHAELWIVTLDMPMQSFPDAQARIAFQRKLGLRSLYVADELVAKFAEQNHILHATMAPSLTHYVDEAHTVIHLDNSSGQFALGHLNEAGQRKVSSLLSRTLARSSAVLN